MSVLRCKQRSLTPEERAAADAAQSIDEKYSRSTPEEVKALLEKLRAGIQEEQSESEGEAVKELG